MWDVDWATVALHTTDLARTERILRFWDGHLAHPSLPLIFTAQLQAAGVRRRQARRPHLATNEFDPDTYGGFLVPFIAQFVVGRDGISDDEANAWEAEQWELAQRSEFFFAGIQFRFTATRPDWQPADSASQYSSFGGKPTAWRGSRPSSFSASSGIRRYETAWLILQKLRRAMVAPESEPLKGEVEIDEFFDGGPEAGHAGRQRGTKALVAVAIEVRGRGSGRLRLQLLSDASGGSLGAFATATTAAGAIVHTDGWSGWRGLAKLGHNHRVRSQRAEPGEHLFPRAHRAVSNLKAWMHGTYRGVGDPHLQVYLDEYAFRHNRRRTPIAAFQTLLGLGALHDPTTYQQITRRAA